MATPAAQTRLTVEHHRRQETQGTAPATRKDWIFTNFQALEESLPLTSIHCELSLEEIYERVLLSD